jgi:thioesterase domain-containing protein
MNFLLRLMNIHLANEMIVHIPSGKIETNTIVAKAVEGSWEGYDEYLGWSDHCHHISYLDTPGNHKNMVKRENAKVLADHLGLIINKIARKT